MGFTYFYPVFFLQGVPSLSHFLCSWLKSKEREWKEIKTIVFFVWRTTRPWWFPKVLSILFDALESTGTVWEEVSLLPHQNKNKKKTKKKRSKKKAFKSTQCLLIASESLVSVGLLPNYLSKMEMDRGEKPFISIEKKPIFYYLPDWASKGRNDPQPNPTKPVKLGETQ